MALRAEAGPMAVVAVGCAPPIPLLSPTHRHHHLPSRLRMPNLVLQTTTAAATAQVPLRPLHLPITGPIHPTVHRALAVVRCPPVQIVTERTNVHLQRLIPVFRRSGRGHSASRERPVGPVSPLTTALTVSPKGIHSQVHHLHKDETERAKSAQRGGAAQVACSLLRLISSLDLRYPRLGRRREKKVRR